MHLSFLLLFSSYLEVVPPVRAVPPVAVMEHQHFTARAHPRPAPALTTLRRGGFVLLPPLPLFTVTETRDHVPVLEGGGGGSVRGVCV